MFRKKTGSGKKTSRRIEPSFGGPEPKPAPKASSQRPSPKVVKTTKPKPVAKKPAQRARKKPQGLIGRIRQMFYWGVTLALWGGIGLAGVVAYVATTLPPLDQITIPERPPSMTILASDGSQLAVAGVSVGKTVHIADLPPYVTEALIAIEDRRFYSHFGIDPVGLGRAVYRNIMARGVSEGGSTLTQQLAKNLFLKPERSFQRKAQEAILALWLEARLTKEEILEHYLNRVYFGAGAYGIEAASWTYFNKPASRLSLQEAALIAGLVKAPSRLSPARNPEAAERRGAVVLQAMVDAGYITSGEAAGAIGATVMTKPDEERENYGYITDWVSDILPDLIGPVEGDLVIQTTIDKRLQAKAQAALSSLIAEQGPKHSLSQGAVVLMNGRGEIKAIVGGTSHKKTPFNRATQAKRQPGSAFKPFVFAAAMERGLRPETVMMDEPIRLGGWSPENYDGKYRGPVSVQDALAQSLNTISVRVAQFAGLGNVVSLARACGLYLDPPFNYSLALGTKEVTPLQLTTAYAPFMNGGYAVTPMIIKSISTADGEVVYETLYDLSQQVMTADTVYLTENLLRHAVTTGTGKRANFSGQPVFGKTGTTQNNRDAWFVGYTPQLIGTVWLGNDDNSPMKNVTGGGLPAILWKEIMESAHSQPVASQSNVQDVYETGALNRLIEQVR